MHCIVPPPLTHISGCLRGHAPIRRGLQAFASSLFEKSRELKVKGRPRMVMTDLLWPRTRLGAVSCRSSARMQQPPGRRRSVHNYAQQRRTEKILNEIVHSCKQEDGYDLTGSLYPVFNCRTNALTLNIPIREGGEDSG